MIRLIPPGGSLHPAKNHFGSFSGRYGVTPPPGSGLLWWRGYKWTSCLYNGDIAPRHRTATCPLCGENHANQQLVATVIRVSAP